MDNRTKIMVFLGILILILLILSINTYKLFSETEELKQEQKEEEMKFADNELIQKDIGQMKNQLTSAGWQKISQEKIEALFNTWLLEKGIILTKNKTLNSGIKEIEFQENKNKIWQEFIPFVSHLINYFREPRLKINSDHIGAKVKFSYLPRRTESILFNEGLLTKYREEAIKLSFPLSKENTAALEVQDKIFEDDPGGIEKPGAAEYATPQPLPGHIEILGYINHGANSFFLMEIKDRKLLLDTISENDEKHIIVGDEDYRLQYQNNLYILRGRD